MFFAELVVASADAFAIFECFGVVASGCRLARSFSARTITVFISAAGLVWDAAIAALFETICTYAFVVLAKLILPAFAILFYSDGFWRWNARLCFECRRATDKNAKK